MNLEPLFDGAPYVIVFKSCDPSWDRWAVSGKGHTEWLKSKEEAITRAAAVLGRTRDQVFTEQRPHMREAVNVRRAGGPLCGVDAPMTSGSRYAA